MAETVPVVGAGFLDALYAYAADVNQLAQEASTVGLQNLQEGIRTQASTMDRWTDLAEHVTTYSRDGRLVIGVGGQFSSEAEQAEYGDDEHPPSPLFRTGQHLQANARKAAFDYIEAVKGRVTL